MGSEMCIRDRTREWEKDGIKRYTTEIIVDINGTMQLLGGRPQGQQQGGDQHYQAGHQQTPRQPPRRAPDQPAPQPEPDFDNFDDDLPF